MTAGLPTREDFSELQRRAGRAAMVKCAADIAELALPVWTAAYPDDDRPAAAIRAAHAWADDPSEAGSAAGEAALAAVRVVVRKSLAATMAGSAAALAATVPSQRGKAAFQVALRAEAASVPVCDIAAVFHRYMSAASQPLTIPARPVRSLAEAFAARR